MANRFEHYTPIQLQSAYFAPNEMPTMNGELWAKALEGQQKQYDTLIQSKGLKPEYYWGDRDAATKWQQAHEQAVQKVTDIYASGNQNAVQLGNKALQDYSSNLRQEAATGDFAKLAQRKAQYDKINEEYNKRDKDTPTFFQQYRTNQFHNSISKDLNQPILDPGIGKYEDINDALQKAKGFMDSDKTGSIQVGNQWIQKETTEAVPQARRDEVFNNIKNDPKFQATQEAAVWNNTRGIDPSKYQNTIHNQIDVASNGISNYISGVNKLINSKNPDEVKQGQDILKTSGLDVSVDGQAGKQTKEAFERFKELSETKKAELEQQKQKPIGAKEIKALETQKFWKEKEDFWNGMFGKKVTKDLDINQYGLEADKNRHKMQQIDYMTAKIGEALIPPPASGLLTPHGVEDDKRTFEDARTQANQLITSSTQGIDKGRKALAAQLGLPNIDQNVYEEILKAHSKAMVGGKFNNDIYQQEIAKNGNWMKTHVGNWGSQVDEHFNANGYDAISKTAFDSKNKGMAMKNYVDGIYGNAADKVKELGGGADDIFNKYYQQYKDKFKSVDEFKEAVLNNQGTVNKDNPFYKAEYRGAPKGGKPVLAGEYNVANNIMKEIQDKTGKTIEGLKSPTVKLYRYTQEDDKMPLGSLSKQIALDVESGNLKGYGIAGNNAVWRDRNGEVKELKGDEDIKNVKVAFVPDPINGARYFVSATIGGKQYDMSSDIPAQHKPAYSKAAAAESLMVKPSNVQNAKALMMSSNLVENGSSAIPNFSHQNKENVNSSKQYIKTSSGNTMNLVLSNDFVSDDNVVVGSHKLGVKAINSGKDQKYVVIDQTVDANGNKEDKIVKLKDGDLNPNTSYYFDSPTSAQEEIHLFTKNNRPDVKREIEYTKQKQKVAAGSTNNSVIQTVAPTIIGNE
jgi:hypothetical protein